MRFPLLRDEDLEEIARIGRLRAPNEACGVLLPAQWPSGIHRHQTVLEMPNRSHAPRDGSWLIVDDIRLSLEEWLAETPREGVEQLVVWHTHPAGNVGPSKEDMATAAEADVVFLVVTLTEQGPIPTWYTGSNSSTRMTRR